MKQSQIILFNGVVIWLTKILQAIPQFIIIPFLINNLGDSGYGVYALVWPIMVSVDQIGRSLQSGIIKYAAQYLAIKDLESVNRIMSSSFVYSLLLGFTASAGLVIVSRFYVSGEQELALPMLIVGVSLLGIIPLTPFVAVIQSKQRFYIDALAVTGHKYLGFIFVVLWFIFIKPSVPALVFIMSLTLLLSRAIQIPIAYKLIPGLDIEFGNFYKETFRVILVFGGVTVFIALSNAANNMGVRWLMGSIVSTGFVAHLAIILLPGQLMSQFIQALTLTVMPATSAYDASQEGNKLPDLLIKGIRYTTMVGGMSVIGVSLFIKDLLNIWLGSDYVFLGNYIGFVFLSVVFLLSTSTAHHMLKGLEKLKELASISILGKVVVPLGLMLVIHSVWGDPYLAVTIGFFSGNMLAGMLHLLYAAKVLNINFRKFFGKAYQESILLSGIILIGGFGLYHALSIDSIYERLLITFLSITVYVLFAYFVISSESERKLYHELLEFGTIKLKSLFSGASD